MSSWIIESDNNSKRFGQGAIARKIKLKLRGLLYDFVLNDDNIDTVNTAFVRNRLVSQEF